eukprot:CAMPEP_0201738564 /NCGR_PEP_ID=MMETSP0593-20130828/45317_1 /ASSEMBLY_ACC=CAM_ASM_000672 /TAXON_ID=267983 /ORGANISM="Skeletonema japonicum, Strain CCMP2506" /LENGTH=697 /DNA_ID=CAMNT_0048232789 /DNA_START=70 /DNA_END=2163 /DNA_ORIENTATION=+
MKLLLMTTSLTALIVTAVVVATAAEANPNRGNYLRHNNDDRILKKIKWEQFADEIQESLASITTAQPSISSTTYGPSASPTKTPTAVPSKEPTLAPTKQPSDNPTPTPSMDPTSSDPVVTTIAPTIAISSVTEGGGDMLSGGTPSAKPTEFNFDFSLGDRVATKITLPSFRLEFVATTKMNRKLRRDELMSGDVEQTFIGIISNQILSYLKGISSRELVSVDLNVMDKSENHFSQMVMFSYDLGGYVTFAGSEDELPPLPTSNELLTEVLGFLKTDSFEEVLKSFDSSGMISIDDVAVSTSNDSGTASQVQLTDSSGTISTSNEKASDGIDTPAVIAFATAFVFTMAVIGFITMRKLREYEENEDDNSLGLVKTTYQTIKDKFNYVSPIKKNRQYDQFESPAASEDSLFGDIERSDSEYPVVTHVDIKQSPSQPLSSTYLPDEAFRAESDVTSERSNQNLSLDLLYSDSDSYFGSSIGTSNISAGLRPRLLSNDFVYSDTDSSLRSGSELDSMKSNSANIYSIAKVNRLLLYNDDAAPSDSEITEAECAAQEVPVDDSEDGNPFASDMTVTGDLFARLNELENKIVFTESQFSQEDAIATKEARADYKTAYSEAEDSSVIRNNDVGVFTDETLGMIQRDRLQDTPPPSETELEGDLIDCSRSSSLLGNVLDESDGDDDDLLFEGSVSTIDSVNDSHC